MRISDWSSYVCSSDRDRVGGDAVALGINGTATAQNDATVTNAMGAALAGNDIILSEDDNDVLAGDALASGLGRTATAYNIRSDPRAEGKACVSTCRSWRSPVHSKKKESVTYNY